MFKFFLCVSLFNIGIYHSYWEFLLTSKVGKTQIYTIFMGKNRLYLCACLLSASSYLTNRLIYIYIYLWNQRLKRPSWSLWAEIVEVFFLVQTFRVNSFSQVHHSLHSYLLQSAREQHVSDSTHSLFRILKISFQRYSFLFAHLANTIKTGCN